MDDAPFEIAVPPAPVDPALAEELAELVNDVYVVAEGEFWEPGTRRTSPKDVTHRFEAGELAVARSADGRLLGCVLAYDLDDETAGFGMLVAAPSERGRGVGRALVDHAEARARAGGRSTIQLQLLVPIGWEHQGKEQLTDWYERLGYELLRTEPLRATHPLLVPRLRAGAAVETREKRLT